MRHQHLLLRPLHQLALVAAALILGGCAANHEWPEKREGSGARPEHRTLEDIPFHAQDAYQCGPAALSTMLNARDIPATPDELVDRVYLPERGGTLQVEMVSAARERGLLVYPLEGSLDALMQEIAAGNPVLVMQNLALEWWPQWHFAVVIGYDREASEVILHTDTRRAHAEPMRPFMNSWKRADYWARVMVPPDQLPATAQPLPWLSAASDLEATGQLEAARRAYKTALTEWPDEPAPRFGLGNVAYAMDRPGPALTHFQQLTRTHPQMAPAWNNLTVLLSEQGCAIAARRVHDCARKTLGDEAELPERPALRETRRATTACPIIRCPER
ncbi:peptidase C39-like protein [Halospina denitrificans]|uniref:Peptidase C39-like protein n=1 Tax=Halospina denitrificans TaxID=332522 RepID=A0A4R7JQC3_9GAMM|nr:PA2778 family cysteine peptidase [Halospina denitrificans]TDT40381.1 peptidase C39-like protein [Halospina denitrificans]